MSVRPRLIWGRLFCPDAKARQGAGTEDVGERHIGGIATVRDENTPDPRDVVTRVKGVPSADARAFDEIVPLGNSRDLPSLLEGIDHFHYVTPFLKTASDPGRHGRRGPQRLTDGYEIVIQEMQRHRMGMISNFFAEPMGQPWCGLIRRWSILNRFYSQTGACST
jgi:hypothetical protein